MNNPLPPSRDPMHSPLGKVGHFGFYKGRVEFRDDPEKLGRLRVRVVGVHPDEGSYKELPWAWPCTPAWQGGGIFATPPVGEHVWIAFESGMADYPIWFGGWWGKKGGEGGAPAPGGSGQGSGGGDPQTPHQPQPGDAGHNPLQDILNVAQNTSALLGKVAGALGSFGSGGDQLQNHLSNNLTGLSGATGNLTSLLNTLIQIGDNPTAIAALGPEFLAELEAALTETSHSLNGLHTRVSSGADDLASGHEDITGAINNQLAVLSDAPRELRDHGLSFIDGLNARITSYTSAATPLLDSVTLHLGNIVSHGGDLQSAIQAILNGGNNALSVVSSAQQLLGIVSNALSTVTNLTQGVKGALSQALGLIGSSGGGFMDLASNLFGALIDPTKLIPNELVNCFGGKAPWGEGILKEITGGNHEVAPDGYTLKSPRGKYFWHSDNQGKEHTSVGDQMKNHLRFNTQTGTTTLESVAGLEQQAVQGRGVTIDRPKGVLQIYTKPAAKTPTAPGAGGGDTPGVDPTTVGSDQIRDISNQATGQSFHPWADGGPVGAVIHDTGGSSLSGAISQLNSDGNSYNYLIDTNGSIYQFTPNGMAGGHAGVGIAQQFRDAGLGNRNMVGIAMVGNGSGTLTAAQHAATQGLLGHLQSVYPNLSPSNVFGHGEFSPGHRDADEGLQDAQQVRENGFGAPLGPQAPQVPGQNESQWQITLDDTKKFAEWNSKSRFKIKIDDDKKKLEIWTEKKQRIILDDKEKRILICTPDGNYIKVDDSGGASIDICQKDGAYIILNVNRDIEIYAPNNLKLKAGNSLSIDAVNEVNIRGGTVNINPGPPDTEHAEPNKWDEEYKQPPNPPKAARANDPPKKPGASSGDGADNAAENPDGLGSEPNPNATPVPGDVRTSEYGPGIGETSLDQTNGPLGPLAPGDVALSPDLADRLGLPRVLQPGDNFIVNFNGQNYRYADYSFISPGNPAHNQIEFWRPPGH